MKTWQKIALVVLIPVAILAFGIWRINVARNQPGVAPHPEQERPLSQDEMVQPRKLFIDDLKSARDLIGKPVWVQAGYELDYYPYAGHRIDFAHPAGVLPSAQRLDIQDVVIAKEPASVASRIPRGDKQAFAVFTMPGDAKTYAAIIASIQGTDSSYYCDNLFYYDDPRSMYNFWPANIWQAIDQHKPIAGMNELQTAMAVGVIQQSESSDYGNRTIYYDAGPKRWEVTFENNKATQVQPQAPTAAQK
ncbi:MAG TPA: hypothetical protein VHX60_16225 [Acidobacteriaceae bacterium]|jgi:hypothetical protein|nr:hypothetical protein [Acidobacteriaceae bacterium]